MAEQRSHIVRRVGCANGTGTNGANRIDTVWSLLVLWNLASWQWNVKGRLANTRLARWRCRRRSFVDVEEDVVDRSLLTADGVELAAFDRVLGDLRLLRFLTLHQHLLLPYVHHVLMMMMTSHRHRLELLQVEVLVRFLLRLSLAAEKAQSSCLRLGLHVFPIKILQT